MTCCGYYESCEYMWNNGKKFSRKMGVRFLFCKNHADVSGSFASWTRTTTIVYFLALFPPSNPPFLFSMSSKTGRVSSSGRIRKPSDRAKASGDVKGLTIPLSSSPSGSPAKTSGKGTQAAYINKKKTSQSPAKKTVKGSTNNSRPVAPLPQRALEV